MLLAWQELRKTEPDPKNWFEHAVWALQVFAGAIGGRRRRNKKGVVSIPYAPTYDPSWLSSRIASEERLKSADKWARGRFLHIFYDFRNVFDRVEAAEFDFTRMVWSIDPPYGHEEKALYTGDWTIGARNDLIRLTQSVIEKGSKVIVWCGEGDIGAWQEGCDGIIWNFRETNVHMKSGGFRKNGEVEPNRKAKGGWLGYSG